MADPTLVKTIGKWRLTRAPYDGADLVATGDPSTGTFVPLAVLETLIADLRERQAK